MNWQPMETMPDERTPVLVADAFGHYFAGLGCEHDLWWITESGVGKWIPTHWMPLPEPPPLGELLLDWRFLLHPGERLAA